jgi:hypothetical protein
LKDRLTVFPGLVECKNGRRACGGLGEMMLMAFVVLVILIPVSKRFSVPLLEAALPL